MRRSEPLPATNGSTGVESPTRWSLVAAFVCFVAAQALAYAWGVTVVELVWNGVMPRPLPIRYIPMLNAGLWIGYIGFACLLSQRFGNGVAIDFDLRAAPAEYGLGLAAGLATQLLAVPALYFVLDGAVGDPGALAEDLVSRSTTAAEVLALAFAVVVMAPLAEEIMYRGVLLSAFNHRFGSFVGVVATAGLFAVVHPDRATYPGLFLFGLVLAGLVVYTNRLGVAVAAHVAFNLSTLILLLI